MKSVRSFCARVEHPTALGLLGESCVHSSNKLLAINDVELMIHAEAHVAFDTLQDVFLSFTFDSGHFVDVPT